MSGNLPATVKTPRPVIIMNSVMAFLGVVLGGGALADFLPVKTVGLLLLIYSGVLAGWGLYSSTVVTPNAKVGAVVGQSAMTGKPELQAGPATSIPDGTPVELVRAGDTDFFGDPVAPPE